MSDFNNNGASNVSKTVKYSDLNLALPIHPVLNDITPLRDIDAVKQAIKNLVLTNFNERPFHPELGSGLTELLFENADAFTAIAIRDEITRVIEDHEPRVNNVNVDVTESFDNNAVSVTVSFNVVFANQEGEVSFNLQRIR